MINKKRIAMVDTDFVKHIISSSPKGETILRQIFKELVFDPVVHPWVAENEFVETGLINLISTGVIDVIERSEIVGYNNEYLKQYEASVSQFYFRINNETLSLNGDIFDFRKSGSSLGEIHSVITAKYLGIPIFCSDDSDSLNLLSMVNDDFYKLKVYKAFDVLNETSKNYKTKITFDDCRRIISKCNEGNGKRYKEQTSIIKSNYKKILC